MKLCWSTKWTSTRRQSGISRVRVFYKVITFLNSKLNIASSFWISASAQAADESKGWSLCYCSLNTKLSQNLILHRPLNICVCAGCWTAVLKPTLHRTKNTCRDKTTNRGQKHTEDSGKQSGIIIRLMSLCILKWYRRSDFQRIPFVAFVFLLHSKRNWLIRLTSAAVLSTHGSLKRLTGLCSWTPYINTSCVMRAEPPNLDLESFAFLKSEVCNFWDVKILHLIPF